MRLVKERREGSRDQDGRTRPGFTGHGAKSELLCAAENHAGTGTAFNTNNRTARGKGTRRRRGRRHLPRAGPLARASAEPLHGQPSTTGPHRPRRGPSPHRARSTSLPPDPLSREPPRATLAPLVPGSSGGGRSAGARPRHIATPGLLPAPPPPGPEAPRPGPAGTCSPVRPSAACCPPSCRDVRTTTPISPRG